MLDRQVLHLPHHNLSYLIGGNGSESLLLLHGMADCALVWSSLADHLGSRYRIIAPDLRGHGESSKDITDYSFASIIADLEALMQHLGVTKVHLLAHSWSGKTAAIWATQQSDFFSSLIFVDPFFMGRFPTLFVQPETGLNRTNLQLQPYKLACQNLQICQVPGNHWAFLVESAAFNDAIERFLAYASGSIAR
jgi:pimeloyl-ACP methyl ester carboxylesterase